MPPERQVFVTVGTTEFDALVEAADSDATHAALAALGYTRVLFQVGLRVDARAVGVGVGREEEARLERVEGEGLREHRVQAAASLGWKEGHAQ